MLALINKRQTIIPKIYSYCVVPKFYPYINYWGELLGGEEEGVGLVLVLVLGGVKKGE